LRDAELLSAALVTGDLKGYHKERDRQTRPMYDLTADLARLAPLPRPAKVLFAHLPQDPVARERFLGMIGGTVPVTEFFSPVRLARLVGWRNLLFGKG
jgi:hypothetical protein